MKKAYLILPSVIAAFGAVALISNSTVFAQTDSPHQTFVASLAQKLGIEESKVQTAVDEIHDEHHRDMEAKFDDKLETLVTNGKITALQKQLILDKEDEIQTQMENLKSQDLSMEERHTKMKELFESLETWAKDNNIDPQYVRFFGHGMGGLHKGFRMGYMMGHSM